MSSFLALSLAGGGPAVPWTVAGRPRWSDKKHNYPWCSASIGADHLTEHIGAVYRYKIGNSPHSGTASIKNIHAAGELWPCVRRHDLLPCRRHIIHTGIVSVHRGVLRSFCIIVADLRATIAHVYFLDGLRNIHRHHVPWGCTALLEITWQKLALLWSQAVIIDRHDELCCSGSRSDATRYFYI
jgi:hypothetical protein